MDIKAARFFLRGLELFELNEKAENFEGISKKDISEQALLLIKSIPGYESYKTDKISTLKRILEHEIDKRLSATTASREKLEGFQKELKKEGEEIRSRQREQQKSWQRGTGEEKSLSQKEEEFVEPGEETQQTSSGPDALRVPTETKETPITLETAEAHAREKIRQLEESAGKTIITEPDKTPGEKAQEYIKKFEERGEPKSETFPKEEKIIQNTRIEEQTIKTQEQKGVFPEEKRIEPSQPETIVSTRVAPVPIFIPEKKGEGKSVQRDEKEEAFKKAGERLLEVQKGAGKTIFSNRDKAPEEKAKESIRELKKEVRESSDMKIYKNPSDDPNVQKLEEEIKETSKTEAKRIQEETLGSMPVTNADREISEHIGAEAQKKVTEEKIKEFIEQNPGKAVAYKETYQPIKNYFSTKESATPSEKDINDFTKSPEFERFEKDTQKGLAARIFKDDKPLTPTEYQERFEVAKKEIIDEFREKFPQMVEEYQPQDIRQLSAVPIPVTNKSQETKESQKKDDFYKNRNLFLEPKTTAELVRLSKEDKKFFESLIKNARKDPSGFASYIKLLMIERAPDETKNNISSEQLETTSQIVAIDFTNKLLAFDQKTGETVLPQQNPVSILAAFANPDSEDLKKLIPDPELRKEIAQAAQEFALVLESDESKAKFLLSPVAGEKVLQSIYGDPKTEYKITTSPTPKTVFAFKPGEFLSKYKGFKSQFELIKNYSPEKLLELSRGSLGEILKNFQLNIKTKNFFSRVFSSLFPRKKISLVIKGSRFSEYSTLVSLFRQKGVPLLVSPSFLEFLGSNKNILYSLGKPLLSPIFKSSFGKFALGIKSSLGAFSKTAGKTITAGLAKLGTGLVAKLGLSTLLTTLGSALGPIGTAIGFLASQVVGYLAGKLVDFLSYLKRKNKDIAASLSLLLLGGGLALGSPLLFGGGVLMGLGTIGVGTVAVGIGGFATSIIAGLTTLVISAIAAPLIASLIGIPLIIGFILFIINSGAYIIPPGGGITLGETVSPYIDIVKIPSPAGPFENRDLPLTITYTITISAKKSTLTNISIQYTCDVIKEGSKPPCPPINPSIPPPPDQIVPGTPFTFTYTVTYQAPTFEDSLVTDNIVVTADTPEKSGTSAAGSASIVIGDPPDECPNGWPIMPEGSTGRLSIIQGPYGPYSHRVIEAIDVWTGVPGFQITARHSGVVTVQDYYGNYGRRVLVTSTCNGVRFSSIYAHLSSVEVLPGSRVTLGQRIGLSGNTGTGPDNYHLHYEFTPPRPVPMKPPYIPKTVPYFCYNGTSLPCNVFIP